jgi:hypothetical protein
VLLGDAFVPDVRARQVGCSAYLPLPPLVLAAAISSRCWSRCCLTCLCDVDDRQAGEGQAAKADLFGASLVKLILVWGW